MEHCAECGVPDVRGDHRGVELEPSEYKGAVSRPMCPDCYEGTWRRINGPYALEDRAAFQAACIAEDHHYGGEGPGYDAPWSVTVHVVLRYENSDDIRHGLQRVYYCATRAQALAIAKRLETTLTDETQWIVEVTTHPRGSVTYKR